jgi:hypothetical protein
MITIISNLNAQALKEGDNMFHVGIGFGGKIGKYDFDKQSPALNIQWERSVYDIEGVGLITGGGYLGYKSFKNEGALYGDYTYKQTWTYWIIGARAAFHVTAIKNDKLDIYGGLMASYNVLTYSYSDNDPYPYDSYAGGYASGTSATVFAGARYFLSDKIGVYGEVGSSINLLTVGASLKF